MKKTYLVAAAALAAVMLTACGNKTENTAATAQAGGQTSSTSQNTAASTDGNNSSGAVSADNSSDNTAGGSSVDAAQTYDAVNQGEEAVGPSDEQAGVESSWSGTYASPNESVQITAADDGGSFSFIFTNSGIGGTASCDVNQGIFEGDDGYVVTFNLDVDTLNISVSNENDENAGDSALSGTYSRQ